MKRYFATILVVEDEKNDQILTERGLRAVDVEGRDPCRVRRCRSRLLYGGREVRRPANVCLSDVCDDGFEDAKGGCVRGA